MFILLKIGRAEKDYKFKEIYNAYHQKIYGYARYITKSEVLAEEITQDVFMKIWENLQEHNTIINFDAWVTTVVRNRSYTYLRRVALERLLLDNFTHPQEVKSASVVSNLIEDELLERLNQIVSRLPKQQRAVYTLSRKEEITYKEIAKRLGISINSVKSHMRAALKKVRQRLEE